MNARSIAIDAGRRRRSLALAGAALAAGLAIGYVSSALGDAPPSGGVLISAWCPEESTLWQQPEACRIVIEPVPVPPWETKINASR